MDKRTKHNSFTVRPKAAGLVYQVNPVCQASPTVSTSPACQVSSTGRAGSPACQANPAVSTSPACQVSSTGRAGSLACQANLAGSVCQTSLACLVSSTGRAGSPAGSPAGPAAALAARLAPLLLFLLICCVYRAPAYAAREILPDRPADNASAAPAPSMAPQVFPSQAPRPQTTPWNQLGLSVTPTPEPTADPMIQKTIREDVEKASRIEVTPTPGAASKDLELSVKQAAAKVVEAAKPNFKTLDIAKLNIQKQIDGLRNGVNMAIAALDADDRYKVLIDAEELWGDKLEEELVFELEMYRQIKYKELTPDERRELISLRDMGYERFNFNIKKLEYNMEILKCQLTWAAYAQYAGISKLQAAIALQREALELQKTNLDILTKKFELGAATRIETENAGLAYEKAQIDLRRQERSLKSLYTGFNKLLGENLATTYRDFDRSQLTPTKRDKPLDDYVSRALEKRSEILIAKQEASLTKRQAELYESEISHHSTLDDKQDAVQAAAEAEIDYDAAAQDIESQINNAYKQLLALRGATAHCESQIKTAEGNYERIQALFEHGMTTAATVEQVRMSLAQARLQLEINQIDIWQQQQKLEIISGVGPGGI